MKRENIPTDPGQSFRFFSWRGSIVEIRLQRSDGPPIQVSGMGDRWHYHPELELTFITEGEGLRFVGDDIAHFTAPDLVLIGSNLPHYWKTGRSSGYCIQFEDGPSAPLAGFRESKALTDLVRRAGRGLSYPAATCAEIRGLLQESLEAPPIARLAKVLQILQLLEQSRPTPLSRIVPGTPGKQSAAIQNAVHFIIGRAGDPSLQLQDVLNHVRMTRPTFSRHIQSALGQSYTSFLQNLRLENARRLLSTTERPVTELAFESGFGNLSHFNALFRKRWAMTPGEFRSKMVE